MKIKYIPNALDICFLTQDVVPCFVGKTGIGKTQSIVQYGKDNGYKVVVVHLSQFEDVGDLTGLPVVVKEDNSKHKYFTVYAKPNLFSSKEDKPLLILLDELNHAKPHIRLAAFQLIRHRSIGGNYLGDNTKIVAACNPNDHENYQQEFFKNEAWENSFCWIKTDFCHESYIKYCSKQEKMKNSKMLSFITENEQVLKETYKDDFSINFVIPTARSIEETASVIYNYAKSNKKTEENDKVLEVIIEGLIGEVVSSSYKHFNPSYITNAEDFLSQEPIDVKTSMTEKKYPHSVSLLLIENIMDLFEKRYEEGIKNKKLMFSEKEAKNFVSFLKYYYSRDIIAGKMSKFVEDKILSGNGFINFETYILNNKEVGNYFQQVKISEDS